MCGIAGFMLNERAVPPREVLDTLQQALAHRGPDGAKRHVDYGLGLVHTRLAIIDLKTGDQPLFGANGTLLIANGEIYNYIELKQNFPQEKFATGSDCELPLMTYAAQGAEFVLLRVPPEPKQELVFLENDMIASYLDRPHEIARYKAMFEQAQLVARDPAESAPLLDRLRTNL